MEGGKLRQGWKDGIEQLIERDRQEKVSSRFGRENIPLEVGDDFPLGSGISYTDVLDVAINALFEIGNDLRQFAPGLWGFEEKDG